MYSRVPKKTLIRCRPVLLIEVKAQNSSAVSRFLAPYGYSAHRLQELIQHQGSAENIIFLPIHAPEATH